jgi:LysM repeat protein
MVLRHFRPPFLRPVGNLVIAGSLILAAGAGYTVQPGDTLDRIARRFGVSTRELAAANGIADPGRIFAGASLVLPGGSREHVVAPGETLSGIAARYGLATRDLAAVNGIASVNYVRAGQRLRLSSAAATASRAPARAASRASVGALLEQTARRYGWRPATIKALAWQESGWNPAAVSSAGAVGVMQVLPSTGRFVSANLVGRPLDLTDPADNIEAGVAFLDYLYGRTGGDIRRTLGGYYQGLRSMRERGVYPDTERYIDNVLVLRQRFS